MAQAALGVVAPALMNMLGLGGGGGGGGGGGQTPSKGWLEQAAGFAKVMEGSPEMEAAKTQADAVYNKGILARMELDDDKMNNMWKLNLGALATNRSQLGEMGDAATDHLGYLQGSNERLVDRITRARDATQRRDMEVALMIHQMRRGISQDAEAAREAAFLRDMKSERMKMASDAYGNILGNLKTNGGRVISSAYDHATTSPDGSTRHVESNEEFLDFARRAHQVHNVYSAMNTVQTTPR